MSLFALSLDLFSCTTFTHRERGEEEEEGEGWEEREGIGEGVIKEGREGRGKGKAGLRDGKSDQANVQS